MEIKSLKFGILNCISVSTLCLTLCLSVSFADANDFDPLEILDSSIPEINDVNTIQYDFVDIAQADLIAKMDDSIGLQAELQRLIGKINSIQFKSKQAEQPIIIMSSVPAEAEDADEQQQESQRGIIPDASVPQDGRTSDLHLKAQTLSMLEQIMQEPQNVKEPLELANILYRCGRLKEAAVFYRQAIDDVNDTNNVLYKDKAWILFQTGNCLQKIDPEAAGKMYKRLMFEYPESFWTDAAKAKDHLIDWYLQQKPNTLLQKRK